MSRLSPVLDLKDFQFSPTTLDRIPRENRIEESFPEITDFVFWQGCGIKRGAMPKAKLVPLVTCSKVGIQGYGQALVFYESLADYIPILKEVVTNKLYKEYPDKGMVPCDKIEITRKSQQKLEKSFTSHESSISVIVKFLIRSTF